MFENMKNESRVVTFDNERRFGVIVRFSEQGFGFGELTLAVDKITGEADCDLEGVNPERCGRIFRRAAGTEVVSQEDYLELLGL